MQEKRKGATKETPTKQDKKKISAKKVPLVREVSVEVGADRHSHVTKSTKKHLLIISVLLIIAGFMAFWQVTHSDFINSTDDALYVTGNRHVQAGLTAEGIVWAFTTDHAGLWIPLTWISYMVDVQLFGQQPGWHHLINLLLHLASTVLLFLVLHRMTKAVWQSAFVAALFALHPLHVESVAWVTERKDVLSTFFWMLTMGIYVSYVARPGLKRYLPLLPCFALGLMAKPMLVTLPFVLLLLDYWPLQRLEQKKLPRKVRKPLSNDKSRTLPVDTPAQPAAFRWSVISPLLVEKIPLFALTLLFGIITYLAQRHEGAVASLEALPSSARAANAFVSYITYIVKMLMPTNLAAFYPHPGSWPLWKVLGSVVLSIVLTVLALKGARKRPYAAVGWLWYVGTLVPVIGVVQVGSQALADRFTYVPLVGLFIIVAWAVPEILKKWRYRKEALIALSSLSLLCLFLVTWRQVGYWRSDFVLWDHAMKVARPSSIIHDNRGLACFDLGNYTQAIADFSGAIEIDPRFGEAYYNRGTAYGRLGNYTQAIADLNSAIEINPRYGKAYDTRGEAYGRLGNYTQAIADFSSAIEIDPRHGDAYNSRGAAYLGLGNYTQAIADFNSAIEIDPLHGDAYYFRGLAYGRLGNYTRAIADFSSAIEIDPRHGDAYYNRGVAYGKLGNRERAIDDMRTGARLGHEGARNFLRGQGAGW